MFQRLNKLDERRIEDILIVVDKVDDDVTEDDVQECSQRIVGEMECLQRPIRFQFSHCRVVDREIVNGLRDIIRRNSAWVQALNFEEGACIEEVDLAELVAESESLRSLAFSALTATGTDAIFNSIPSQAQEKMETLSVRSWTENSAMNEDLIEALARGLRKFPCLREIKMALGKYSDQSLSRLIDALMDYVHTQRAQGDLLLKSLYLQNGGNLTEDSLPKLTRLLGSLPHDLSWSLLLLVSPTLFANPSFSRSFFECLGNSTIPELLCLRRVGLVHETTAQLFDALAQMQRSTIQPDDRESCLLLAEEQSLQGLAFERLVERIPKMKFGSIYCCDLCDLANSWKKEQEQLFLSALKQNPFVMDAAFSIGTGTAEKYCLSSINNGILMDIFARNRDMQSVQTALNGTHELPPKGTWPFILARLGGTDFGGDPLFLVVRSQFSYLLEYQALAGVVAWESQTAPHLDTTTKLSLGDDTLV